MAVIAVGDKLPAVTLYENSPDGKVDIADLCAGKKVSSDTIYVTPTSISVQFHPNHHPQKQYHHKTITT